MNEFLTAQDAIDWVNGARWKGEKHGLENTRALLEALGHPEARMGRVLHVAGTNGKGSVCAMLDAGLRACGFRTGLFTSPYLCRFHERIRVNGAPISDGELTNVAGRVRAAAETLAGQGVKCTTFELLTAMACLHYAETGVDFSVMEVGMGGRLDSTNVLSPEVSVIAAIGMDHMARLGGTLPEIAAEKAGIIKPETPAVVLSQDAEVMDVFRERAREMRAPLFETAPYEIVESDARGCTLTVELPAAGLVRQTISLPGAHQAANACLALTALDRLKIDMHRARIGVARAKWPGRLEWIGNVLIDGAHNPQGAQALRAYAEKYLKGRRVVLLTGMMQDKQHAACADIFSAFADEIVTTGVDWPRALAASALAEDYHGRAVSEPDVPTALARARRMAGEDGAVVAAGSIYLAGDVRNLLLPDDDGRI